MKEKLKDKKTRLLLIVIIVVLVIIGVLFFTGNTNTGSVSDRLKVNFGSNIQTNIKNYKFDLKTSSYPSSIGLYTNIVGDNTFVANAATFLNMTLQPTTDNSKAYLDSAGNQMMYYSNSNLLTINNISNDKLKNFNKDNALILLENIFKTTFKDYYMTGIVTNDTGTVLSYSIKINSIPVIKDYNVQTSLSVYLQPDGTLTKLSWEYLEPQISATVKLKSIDDIKNNVNELDKGIYPNPTTGQGGENISIYKDFTGTVDITDVEINYLLNSNSNYIQPVYKFIAKFIADDGTSTDGSIIVPASDTSSK